MNERPPRNDVQAERAVLAGVLAGGVNALDVCREVGLRAAHFYQPGHEELFAMCERLAAQGVAVDPVTVSGAMNQEERRKLLPLLPDLVTQVPLVTALSWHAQQVVDLAALRELQAAGVRIQQYGDTAPVDARREALERSRAALDAVEVPEQRETASRISELVPQVLGDMESEHKRGLSTGLPDLDALLGGGPAPGQTFVLGARPSVGKTMLGMNMVRAACEAGEEAVVFSLEMTRHELTQRFLAMVSGVPLQKIRSGSQHGELGEGAWGKVAKATSEMAEWALTIDDDASMTVADMRSRLRKVTRKGRRVGLIAIDYVQLVRPTDPRIPRQEQVAGVSSAVKALSKDFGCPVLLLAQLSRATEQRRTAMPMLSDLRESGALENDADIVVLMHLEKEGDDMQLVVAKNRQGERGSVTLGWQPGLMRAVPNAWSAADAALWEQRMGGR